MPMINRYDGGGGGGGVIAKRIHNIIPVRFVPYASDNCD